MSKQSERVKTWRKRSKSRIIESMGGRCVICGYNKCPSALALHHLDPSQKDIGFGAIRANPKNWNSIVNELKKCVLVCHNCHSEVHSDYTVIPDNAAIFNEKFTDYKSLEQLENKPLTPCPVCGKLKPVYLKNCSLECATKSKYKVDWDNLNLVEELKTKSIVTLAEELGCSDTTIYKRLRKLGMK